MKDEAEKELENKAAKGVSAGLIANALLVLVLGIVIGATKGKIVKKLF